MRKVPAGGWRCNNSLPESGIKCYGSSRDLKREVLLVSGGDQFDWKWDTRTEEALLAEIDQLVFLRNGNHLVVYGLFSERSSSRYEQNLNSRSCSEVVVKRSLLVDG